MKHYKLFIGGKWVDSDERFNVMDKYHGNPFATIAQAAKENVDNAVISARNSFNNNYLTPTMRYNILMNVAEIVTRDKEILAEILSKEVGKPISEARGEVSGVILNFKNMAEEAKRITGDIVPIDATSGFENRIGFTLRVPVGIVCAITPFNYPLSLSVSKVAPAIAAGNAVILKPTQQTPVNACKLVEVLLEAGLPPEHIQLVMGPGSTVGEMLLNNNDINFYSFTGSAEIGEHITNTIGIRRSTMELGSNAAVIVHKDADIEAAAKECTLKGFYNAGQVCVSIQRIVVHKDVFEKFVSISKKHAESLVLGNPMEENTTMGPMISKKEAERVAKWVDEAVSQGAKTVCGGKIHNEIFYLPTILTDVKKDMKVYNNEIFGPVIIINTYNDFDEAISYVNDSVYGLQAGVYTKDIHLAMTAARKIQCGGVIINDTSYFKARNMPYGGLKKSGFGKEGGKYAVEEMTDEKMIVLNV